jgi:hypothetical protein
MSRHFVSVAVGSHKNPIGYHKTRSPPMTSGKWRTVPSPAKQGVDAPAAVARRSVLVLGGLTRLSRLYQNAHAAHQVVVANTDSALVARRLDSFDAVVVVPTNLSHQAARRALDRARRKGLGVMMATGPGLHTVRRAIDAALEAAA